MCWMRIMNGPYDYEDKNGTMRLSLGWITTSKCITGDAPSGDLILRSGSYQLIMRRTIDHECHYPWYA